MAAHHLDGVHHLVLVLLSLLVAAALYRFAATLLDGLPWPAVLP